MYRRTVRANAPLIALLSLLLLSGLYAWGCSRVEPAVQQKEEETVKDGGETKDDRVTVTLYFRRSVDTEGLALPRCRRR